MSTSQPSLWSMSAWVGVVSPDMTTVRPGVGTRTEIRTARVGPKAGVYGAALLAVQELNMEVKA